MAIGDDFSIATSGNIRYTGSGTNYTVIAFHRWLGDLMDDAQAAGNDILDITNATASERSTDNIITLNSPYNIDDITAQHLYDGSVIQTSGDVIYDGVLVFAAAGTYLNVVQSGKLVTPNFWTTGLNADSSNGISHRFMVKVRTGAADVDGRRLIGWTREFGFTYSEFKINGTSRGNNVMALTYATDLNNQTAIATVKGWTTITNTTEGYKLLDVDNDGLSEQYYSEWNRDTYTINQFYERMKWLTKRAVAESTYLSGGANADYAVGNGTIVAQGQSFTTGANAMFVTRAHANLKLVGTGGSGNIVAKLYASDGASPPAPTGAALATSVGVDATKLTTTYTETEFGFDTVSVATLTAATQYFVSFEYAGGDGSNYVKVRGDSTGAYASQSRASKTGAWAGDAGTDLHFAVFTSPKLYGIPGERFRGINYEIIAAKANGTAFSAFEPVSWTGGSTGQLFASVFLDSGAGALTINVVASAGTFTRTTGSFIADGFRVGQTIVTSGFSNGGNNTSKVISTVTATIITVTSITGLVDESGDNDERVKAGHMWLQLLTGVAPIATDTITGTTSGGTSTASATVERTLSFPFIGQSTGSALIGAYGVGVEIADVVASDKLFDLTNTQKVPPNSVSFTVSGLVSSEDRLLVGPATGNSLNTSQLTLSVTLSGAGETAVVVTTTIPSDTPSSGTIRVLLNSGIYRRVPYTSFSAATFVIGSTDFTSDPATAPKNVYISYIDKVAGSASEFFTVVYSGSDRSLFVRVRDGGGTPTKTFETTGTLGSAGGSATTIRTSDS